MPNIKNNASKTKKRRKGIGFYALANRIHTIAGIFVAPLILVAAFSGLFYSFAPSLEKVVYHDALNTSSDAPPRPLAEQIAAAKAQHPDLQLEGVQVSDDPGKTTRVLFEDPSLPDEQYHHVVFVDPGDLEIKGDMTQYGIANALPLRSAISRGHKDLWLGTPGEIYSETAASWLGALTLCGIWLWWSTRTKKRPKKDTAKKTNDTKANKAKTRPKSPRVVALKRHSLLGVIIIPGLLIITATGVASSHIAGHNISSFREHLNWTAPKPDISLSEEETEHLPTAPNLTTQQATRTNPQTVSTPLETYKQVDTVINTAKATGMLTGTLEADAPHNSGEGWMVKETREPWKMESDAAIIDGSNGKVIREIPFSSWPMSAKLVSWFVPFHMGILFGVVSQILLGLLALGIITMVLFGYYMWWTRGRGKKPGKLPPPASAKASPTEMVVVITALVAYSIYAPTFGISLLLFLAIDTPLRLSLDRRKKNQKREPAKHRMQGSHITVAQLREKHSSVKNRKHMLKHAVQLYVSNFRLISDPGRNSPRG